MQVNLRESLVASRPKLDLRRLPAFSRDGLPFLARFHSVAYDVT